MSEQIIISKRGMALLASAELEAQADRLCYRIAELCMAKEQSQVRATAAERQAERHRLEADTLRARVRDEGRTLMHRLAYIAATAGLCWFASGCAVDVQDIEAECQEAHAACYAHVEARCERDACSRSAGLIACDADYQLCSPLGVE